MLENVKASLIESILKATSPIQCQLRCNRMVHCNAIGYRQNGIGKLTDCYFLKESSEDASGKTLELFVMRKVMKFNYHFRVERDVSNYTPNHISTNILKLVSLI